MLAASWPLLASVRCSRSLANAPSPQVDSAMRQWFLQRKMGRTVMPRSDEPTSVLRPSRAPTVGEEAGKKRKQQAEQAQHLAQHAVASQQAQQQAPREAAPHAQPLAPPARHRQLAQPPHTVGQQQALSFDVEFTVVAGKAGFTCHQDLNVQDVKPGTPALQAGVSADPPGMRLVVFNGQTVRAASGRLSALGVFLCKSVSYGAFVRARRALSSRKRRFPAPPGS